MTELLTAFVAAIHELALVHDAMLQVKKLEKGWAARAMVLTLVALLASACSATVSNSAGETCEVGDAVGEAVEGPASPGGGCSRMPNRKGSPARWCCL